MSVVVEHVAPSDEVIESRHPRQATNLIKWLAGGVLATLIIASYFDSLEMLVKRWSTEADYSHGFFVPVFSAYLLWRRRSLSPASPIVGSWWGAALLLLASALRCAAVYYSYQLVDPCTIPLSIAGVTLLLGGWRGMRYAWPAIFFLYFMVPLPGFLSTSLSGPLQRIATVSSVYLLQTVGVSAVAQGNVIWLSAGKIGVVEACSGLRMLTLFFAICVGACFIIQRPKWKIAAIVASAIPIGVAANILRITATGILYETAGQELAERVFHDFAGWLMMPTAMILLGIELLVLSKLFIDPGAVDVLKLNLEGAAQREDRICTEAKTK